MYLKYEFALLNVMAASPPGGTVSRLGLMRFVLLLLFLFSFSFSFLFSFSFFANRLAVEDLSSDQSMKMDVRFSGAKMNLAAMSLSISCVFPSMDEPVRTEPNPVAALPSSGTFSEASLL